jgi:hypothetical protein
LPQRPTTTLTGRTFSISAALRETGFMSVEALQIG